MRQAVRRRHQSPPILPGIALAAGVAFLWGCGQVDLWDNPLPPSLPGAKSIIVTGSTYNGSDYDWLMLKFDSGGRRDESWDRTFDNGLNDETASLAVDGAGNVYVAGYTEQAGTGRDWWVKKFDRRGREDLSLWNKTFDGGSGLDEAPGGITVSGAGHIIIGGYINTGNHDWWIRGYDDSGYLLAGWNKTTGGADNDAAYALCHDGVGSIYAVGYETDGLGRYLVKRKFDESGNENIGAYVQLGGVGDHRASACGVDSAGNLWIAGLRTNAITGADWWILKYRPDDVLDISFMVDSGSSGSDAAYALAVDGSDNVYVAGYMNIGATADWCLIKYNSSGAQQWKETFDTHTYHDWTKCSVAATANGTVYFAGHTYNGQNYDLLLKKFDAHGNERWSVTYDGGGGPFSAGGTEGDFATAIVIVQ